MAQLDRAFRDLPFFLAFAAVRSLGNAWHTTRRMSRDASGCLYGWYAVGATLHCLPAAGCGGIPMWTPPASVGWLWKCAHRGSDLAEQARPHVDLVSPTGWAQPLGTSGAVLAEPNY